MRLGENVVAASSGGSWWRGKRCGPGLVALVLAAATLVVYAPAVRNEFVNYDDSDYVTANGHVTGGLKWTNVVWAFRAGHASNWHPLTWVSHETDCELFGLRAGLHHLTNVVLHVLNTVLLFGVWRRMTGADWRSALVAGLFALHPLHVESVAWVSERKDVLSTFFFLLTVGAYVRYAEGRREEGGGERAEARRPESEGGPKSGSRDVTGVGCRVLPREHAWRETDQVSRFRVHVSSIISRPLHFYLLALVFFTLGLMSKPMLVTVPFVLLLLDYWPLGRWRVGGRESGIGILSRRASRSPVANGGKSRAASSAPAPGQRARSGRLLLEKLPFVALSGVSCYVTFVVQAKGGAVSASLTLGGRIANAIVSYVRYIGKMLWPDDLSVLYPHPGSWAVWQVLVSAGLLLAISVVAVVLGRRRPYLVVGWLWFMGTLVPVIGLVQVGIQSMADRYTYIPLVGLFVAVVWGIGEWAAGQAWRGDVVAVGVPVCLAGCAWLTVRQIEYWRNSETLFRRAVAVTKKNYLAYNNLGFYLSGKGRADEAMENYRKALEINPAYEDALNNLGYALAGRKEYAEAIRLYEAALRVRPNHVEVHNNLGNALSETGRIEEAIRHYRFVLERKPEHADAHNNLGIALAMQGKLDEAITEFHDAIRSKPNYASAHSNLGNALAAQHKLEEAIQEYQETLRLNPKEAQAHNNLGNVLTEQGRTEEAIGHYREALGLNADNPEAHYNLGLALARQGQRNEAAAHFTEALKLKPDYAEARKQLEALGPDAGPLRPQTYR